MDDYRLERLADGASAEDVFKTEAGRIQDGLTVGEWVRRHVWLQEVRIVLNAAVRVIFGADMNEVSFLHFLMYCQASGGVMRLCEIEDGAQEQRILGGAQSIAQILADQLNAPLHLNRPVTRIEQSDCGVSVMASAHICGRPYFVNGATPLGVQDSIHASIAAGSACFE